MKKAKKFWMRAIFVALTVSLLLQGVLLVLPNEASGGQLVVQPSEIDAAVRQANPNTNYGKSPTAPITSQVNANNRFLLKFDISTLVAGNKVTSAVLQISGPTGVQCSNWDASTKVDAYRVRTYWGESSVTWNKEPDYAAEPSGQAPDVQLSTLTFTITELVGSWYYGVYDNYGVMLRMEDEGGDAEGDWCGNQFFTREASVATSLKPKLTIDYEDAPPAGNDQVHWGFGDGEDLPESQPRGTSRYVDCEDGDDANDGLSWLNAVATIQAAVNLAVSGAGDYIYVKACVYYEDVIINAKNNLHLVGEGDRIVFVLSINILSTSNVEVTGFGIDDQEYFGLYMPYFGAAMFLSEADHLNIHDNLIWGSYQPYGYCNPGIFMTSVDSSRIYKNRIEACVSIKSNMEMSYNEFYENLFVGMYGIEFKRESGMGAFWNSIHHNRFEMFLMYVALGRGTPRTDIPIAIWLDDANYTIISSNVFGQAKWKEGYPDYQVQMRPIYDNGLANAWIDNHWSGWLELYFGPFENVSERLLMQQVDIPSEGKVTVRLLFDPFWALGTITLRVRDCWTGELLAPLSSWNPVNPNRVFPTVEVAVNGGRMQFDITVQSQFPLPPEFEMWVEIIDN